MSHVWQDTALKHAGKLHKSFAGTQEQARMTSFSKTFTSAGIQGRSRASRYIPGVTRRDMKVCSKQPLPLTPFPHFHTQMMAKAVRPSLLLGNIPQDCSPCAHSSFAPQSHCEKHNHWALSLSSSAASLTFQAR